VRVHGNGEARRAERDGVLGGDVLGSDASSFSAVTWRLAYKAAPGPAFVDIKYIGVKFSWGPAHRRPHKQTCGGVWTRDRRL